MAEPVERIELRLRFASQLFHALDQAPFRDSELAHDAEEYIIGHAMELPADCRIAIVVHLPSIEIIPSTASDLTSAVKVHFDLRSRSTTRELRELFKAGRQSLIVGFAILSFCLVLSWWLAGRDANGPTARIVQESFVILGWVAIWKPSDIFLYGWPPLVRRRRLFRRLSNANVTVRAEAPGPFRP